MTLGNGVGITEDAALPFQQWAEEIAERAAFNLYGADFNVLTVLSSTWASGNIGGDGTILANGIACGELYYGSLIGRDASGRAVPAGGYQMPTPTSEGYLRADTDPSSGWYFAEPVIVQDAEPDPPAGGSALWVNGSTGEAKAWDGSAWASIKGLNGADGTNGADGLGFNPVGEWAGCTDYDVRDVVTYLGSSYVQIAAPGDACATPDSDPDAWKLLAAAGAAGPSAVSEDAGNTLTLGGDGLHFTTAPPDSDAYVWCKSGDDPQERYDLAKTLTPNGQPLSATNRATLIILTGTYAGSLNVDASFVDVYGMGQQPNLPAVTLGGINVTAADVRVSGISVGAQAFRINGLAWQVFANCSGTGMFSFGGAGGGAVASGTFVNCTAGTGAFGGGFNGLSSGTFVNCTSAGSSFGNGATASGTFTNCTAGISSFGAVTRGVASGTFVNCTGGLNSFGNGPLSGMNDPTIAASARLIGCRVTSGTFNAAPQAGAILRYCLDGNYNEVNSP
jgi:hypothetical protein